MLNELPFLFSEIESEQVNYLCCPWVHNLDIPQTSMNLSEFELVMFFKLYVSRFP